MVDNKRDESEIVLIEIWHELKAKYSIFSVITVEVKAGQHRVEVDRFWRGKLVVGTESSLLMGMNTQKRHLFSFSFLLFIDSYTMYMSTLFQKNIFIEEYNIFWAYPLPISPIYSSMHFSLWLYVTDSYTIYIKSEKKWEKIPDICISESDLICLMKSSYIHFLANGLVSFIPDFMYTFLWCCIHKWFL